MKYTAIQNNVELPVCTGEPSQKKEYKKAKTLYCAAAKTYLASTANYKDTPISELLNNITTMSFVCGHGGDNNASMLVTDGIVIDVDHDMLFGDAKAILDKTGISLGGAYTSRACNDNINDRYRLIIPIDTTIDLTDTEALADYKNVCNELRKLVSGCTSTKNISCLWLGGKSVLFCDDAATNSYSFLKSLYYNTRKKLEFLSKRCKNHTNTILIEYSKCIKNTPFERDISADEVKDWYITNRYCIKQLAQGNDLPNPLKFNIATQLLNHVPKTEEWLRLLLNQVSDNNKDEMVAFIKKEAKTEIVACPSTCQHYTQCVHKSLIPTVAANKEPSPCEPTYVPLSDVYGLCESIIFSMTGEATVPFQAGIGKSRIANDYISNNPESTYLSPRHDLGEQQQEDFQERHYYISKTAKLPEMPENKRKEVEQLMKIGANKMAKDILKETEEGRQYVSREKTICGGTITTHHNGVNLQDIDFNNTWIIDESIVDTLLPMADIKITDLTKIAQRCESSTKAALMSVVAELMANDKQGTTKNGFDLDLEQLAEIDKVLNRFGRSLKVEGNVPAFLGCSYYTKNTRPLVDGKNHELHYGGDPDQVFYVSMYSLPKKEKLLILDATVTPYIAENLYKVKYEEPPLAKYKGQIIQHMSKGCSVSGLRKYKEDIATRVKVNDVYAVITMKQFSNYFNTDRGVLDDGHKPMYYGALTGSNLYEGKNIGVVGTFHPPEEQVYLYTSAILDKEMEYEKKQLKEVNDYSGFKGSFKFRTYDDLDLREVHLYLIQRELEQAVNRCRPVRHDVKCYVYSDFPVKQAEYHD